MNFNEINQIILRQQGIDKPRSALAEPYLGRFRLKETTRVERLDIQVGKFTTTEFSQMRKEEDVASIAPAMPVTLIRPLGDAQMVARADIPALAWGVRAVKADASPYKGTGVVVAVLDTGIDISHPAFAGMNIVQKDFTGEGDGDGNGHGTHCAGTIFGQEVDGCRIGVAPGIERVLIGKVLNKDGGGSTDGVVEGLTWAINEGAHVISLSLGISFPHYVQNLKDSGVPELAATSLGLEAYRANVRLFDAIIKLMDAQSKATANPTVLVAASGNESNRNSTYGAPPYVIFTSPPATADGAISVGAVDELLSVAPFSNTRPTLVAPGVGIVSAKTGGGLVSLQGTSMAAPHVAGVAALYADMLTQEKRLTLQTLTAELIAGAQCDPLKVPYDSIDVGAGLVQAPVTAAANTGQSAAGALPVQSSRR